MSESFIRKQENKKAILYPVVQSTTGERVVAGPKRLAVCLDDSPELGGLARGVRDLATALGGRILSLDSGRLPSSPGDTLHSLERLSTGSGVLSTRHLRLAKRVKAVLDDAIAGSEIVVIHSLYRAHVPFIRQRCLRHGVPYWIVTHGMLDPWVTSKRAFWKRSWLTLHGKQCLADAARVVVSTRAERDKAVPWLPGNNTSILPWPVDVPGFADRAACGAAVRARLGIPVEDRILLALTRYDTLKRPVHTIAAFAEAKPPGWHLVMAGYDGDLTREGVAAQARRLCCSAVHLLGPVTGDDKRDLISAADAFVSLSWRENFGYSLVEAMASGLPAVAAPDNDIVWELPGECRAWVLRDHSIEEAVRCIAEITSASPGERQKIGATGQFWVGEHLARRTFESKARTLAEGDIFAAQRR